MDSLRPGLSQGDVKLVVHDLSLGPLTRECDFYSMLPAFGTIRYEADAVDERDDDRGRVSAPRLRRLAADFEAVRGEFSGHPYVFVSALGPNRPPEAYRVTFRVRGLRLEGNQPVPTDHHEVEIQLPLGYPREKPLCTPLTPLFHPNVKDYYCIQDYWAAGQSLVDTIAKIADMIQFKVYNPASPLDALAARWAQQNPQLFPLGNVSLGAPEVEIVLGSRTPLPQSESIVTEGPLPELTEPPGELVGAIGSFDTIVTASGEDLAVVLHRAEKP
jgi:hypothetical protein